MNDWQLLGTFNLNCMQVDLAASLLGEYIALLGSSGQTLAPVLRDALARLVAAQGGSHDDDIEDEDEDEDENEDVDEDDDVDKNEDEDEGKDEIDDIDEESDENGKLSYQQVGFSFWLWCFLFLTSFSRLNTIHPKLGTRTTGRRVGFSGSHVCSVARGHRFV